MSLKKATVALVLVQAALGSSFAWAADEKSSPVEAQARALLNALISKDDAGLQSRAVDTSKFFAGGKLRTGVEDFLYKNRGEGRSILEIARLGKTQVKLIPRSSDRYIAIYFPTQDANLVNGNPAYLKEQWMKRYFACEFSVVNGAAKLADHFCFAETSGPFASER